MSFFLGGTPGSSGFQNLISGGGAQKVLSPDLWAKGTPGGHWQEYLNDLYATATPETPQYKAMSTALRDDLGQESMTSADILGRATSEGGFYDSGARIAGLLDINRNKMRAYSQGLTAILAKLEEQKLTAAYPFLQAKLGAYDSFQSARQGADAERNQRFATHAKIAGDVMGMGSMGGGMGGG